MPAIPEIPEVPTASGLDGVVVASTQLSDVDGEHGRLVIRGHAVEDLVARATFEDVCCLMWDGSLPSAEGRAAMRASLARAREDAFGRLDGIGDALDAADGMEALRAAIGHVRAGDDAALDRVRITGAIGVFAAAWARRQKGRPLVSP